MLSLLFLKIYAVIITVVAVVLFVFMQIYKRRSNKYKYNETINIVKSKIYHNLL